MKILAFDLAGCTGWATRTPQGGVVSGILDLKLGEDEHPGRRWERARATIESLAISHQADVLAWERIVALGGSSRANVALYGLEAQLVEVTWRCGYDALTVMPATLKKFATGRGNAKKPDMVAAAKAHWPGWVPATHDEADARFVLLWAENEIAAAQAAGRAS